MVVWALTDSRPVGTEINKTNKKYVMSCYKDQSTIKTSPLLRPVHY